MSKLLSVFASELRKFEKRHQPLASMSTFISRALVMALVAFCLTAIFVMTGSVGFHFLAKLSWLESAYNAAMVVPGVGLADPMPNAASKIFAGLYALFSGLFFAVIIGVLFAPFAHRLYHKFHIDENVDD